MFLTFELFYIVERCSKWVWSRSKFCWSCTISLFDKNSFYRVVVWVWTNKYKYGSKYLLFPKRANANTVWQLWWYFPTIKKKIKENFCWYCREKTKIGKYIWKSVFFLKKGYAFRNSVTWILLFDKWNWWKVCERIIACWGMGKNKCVGVGCWKNIFNAIFIKIQEKS